MNDGPSDPKTGKVQPQTGMIQPTFAGQSKPPSSGLGAVLQLILFVAVLAGLAYGAVHIWETGDSGYAEVIFLRGEARVAGQLVSLGDKLPPSQQVELGDGARCFLQLPSGLVLKLASKARLTLGKTPDDAMTLAAGSLNVEIRPGAVAPPTTSMQTIRLPDGGTVEARSTRFELRVEKQRSILAVFEGAAEVSHEGKQKVAVKAAEGSVIERGSARKVTLPTPPVITAPAADAKLPLVVPEVAVTPIDGAVAYVWEVRTASGFETVYVVTLEAASGRLPRLPRDGRFRLTARAVIELEGGGRIEGMRSKPVTVQLTVYRQANRLRNLAHNFLINGKPAEAVDKARESLALWPGDPKMLRTLAQSLFLLDRVDEGLKAARELAESNEPEGPDELGELLLELRKTHADHPGVKALGKR